MDSQHHATLQVSQPKYTHILTPPPKTLLFIVKMQRYFTIIFLNKSPYSEGRKLAIVGGVLVLLFSVAAHGQSRCPLTLLW